MRGVNKLVLEINSTEDEYFEKAILFVRPDKADCAQSELSKGARRLLDCVEAGQKRRRLAPLIAVLASVALMAAATAAIIIFC